MIEYKPSHRQQYIVARSVQDFVELFDNELGIRQVFLSPLEDSLKGVIKEVRPRLRDEIVTYGILPHPILTVEAVKKATERQKRHSPLHGFFLSYSMIADALKKHVSSCRVEVDTLLKLCLKKRVFEKTFVSLCPNACFLTMSPRTYSHCETCGEETTIFQLYRCDRDFLNAWNENIFFEAWAYSLLKRNHISCEPSITIFREGIDVGEIDLLVNVDKKSIIEVTKGRGIAQVAYELFGKNELLGGGYQLMLLHTRKVEDKLKRIFRDIIVLDKAISDPKFGKKFLGYFLE